MDILYLKGLLINKNKRSVDAITNIGFSFFLKGASIVVQFALVPLTIDYLDKYQYGIWLTLASILGWFSFFDVGIGNGLRNKLAETLAKKQIILARTYISTSYAVLTLIFVPLILIFWLLQPFFLWTNILNAPIELEDDLSRLAIFVFSFFSLRFIFGLIGNILFADQKPALNNLIAPLGGVISLLLIWILKLSIPGTLFWVGIIYGGVPLLIFIFFNIYFFRYRYKFIAPSIKFVDFSILRDIMGLGIQFFVIQIAAMILFTTSNILLTQFFGPEEVTSYNIAFKYFTALSMVFGIIITPFWSAITEASASGDIKWIKSTIKKLNIISVYFVIICIIMFFVSDHFYNLWIGSEAEVDKSISLGMAGFVIISLIASPANTYINGVGKIRLQLFSAIFSIVMTIPLAFLFCKIWEFGPVGVIMATICTTFPSMILWRIQYHKLINGTANGLWNK